MTLCPSRGGVMVVRSTAPSSALGWYSGGAVLNGAKCSSNSRSAACAKTGAEQMGESVINAASTANGAHAVRLWAQMLGETLSMPVSLAENLQRWQITVVHLAHMRGGTAKCGDGMEVQTRTNAPQKQMGPALLPTPLLPARGLLFRRTVKEALGFRCFHPPTNWWVSLPVLAPASGSFSSVPTFPDRSLSSSYLLSSVPRPIIHSGIRSQAAGFRPKPSSFHRSIAECSVYPVDQRSRSPQTTCRAPGRSLLHDLSQRPRGQSPPRQLGSKNSLRNQALRPIFLQSFIALPMN